MSKPGCTALINTKNECIGYICNFASTDELKGKSLTYENVKALVLEAGRFSVFEATATQKHARLFTDLTHDPELETYELQFPWTSSRAGARVQGTGGITLKRTPEQLREIEERLSPSQILSDSTSRQDVEDKQNLLAHIQAIQKENDELRERAPKYARGQTVWAVIWQPMSGNHYVESDTVEAISIERTGTYYSLDGCAMLEDCIYPTRELAQAELDRREGRRIRWRVISELLSRIAASGG